MLDYLGVRVHRRTVAELALSALPDAPMRPDPPAHGTGGHGLRRRAAAGLLRLAERLEPGTAHPAGDRH
jgi:hypothetical protein